MFSGPNECMYKERASVDFQFMDCHQDVLTGQELNCYPTSTQRLIFGSDVSNVVSTSFRLKSKRLISLRYKFQMHERSACES